MTSLTERIASYGRYHRDWRNRMTHFIGVPLIVFSLLSALSSVRLVIAGVTLTPAEALSLAATAGYLAVDIPLGAALGAVVFLPMLLFADWLGRIEGTAVLWLSAILFIGGWAFQLLGHRFEGNRPALLDNMIQIFAAPIFLAAEAVFALGFRQELRREIERRLQNGEFVDGTGHPGSPEHP